MSNNIKPDNNFEIEVDEKLTDSKSKNTASKKVTSKTKSDVVNNISKKTTNTDVVVDEFTKKTTGKVGGADKPVSEKVEKITNNNVKTKAKQNNHYRSVEVVKKPKKHIMLKIFGGIFAYLTPLICTAALLMSFYEFAMVFYYINIGVWFLPVLLASGFKINLFTIGFDISEFFASIQHYSFYVSLAFAVVAVFNLLFKLANKKKNIYSIDESSLKEIVFAVVAIALTVYTYFITF